MAERNKQYLLTLMQSNGNNLCCDCKRPDPEWASYNLGIFICEICAAIHRSLGSHISKIKSIKLDNWEPDQIRMMEAQGNLRNNAKYEQNVPSCYRRPCHKDVTAFKEQWVHAKYERMEFMDPDQQSYLLGHKEGYMWKRGKGDRKFNKRKFVLDETENTLKYFNRDDAKEPKAVMRIDDLNCTLVPDKVGNPYGMQLQFEQDGHTRNIFLYTENGKDLIDWYTAIRSTKLNRLRIAFPAADDKLLCEHLTRDFLKEGWVNKTGPRQGDAFRKRWATLDKRKFMYYEDPLDAFPKGEIFVGTKEKGYSVKLGLPPGMRDPGYGFTLKTPDRHFHFSVESDDEQKEWLEILKCVISTPLSPQDTSSMFRTTNK